MRWMSRAAAFALMAIAPCQAAFASGQPVPWGLGLQAGASPIKTDIAWFHDGLLLPVITVITLFVLALLLYVMSRFSAARNPTPSRTAHNTTIEVLWTVVPIVILVVIAIPSFRLLYKQDRAVNPDMTIKVTGRQWYWQYEYPDHGTFVIDSRIVRDKDGNPAGNPRLLEVDNRLVVPVGATVRTLVAGADVMHSFFVPSLGVQIYSVPGRLNETWFQVEKEGIYYGQCNQICGTDHAYMPIAIEAVSKAKFQQWLDEAKKKFAADEPARPVRVAAAD
jgi:cytochrome c oxidase subunit 2